jgi:hypothetical protein
MVSTSEKLRIHLGVGASDCESQPAGATTLAGGKRWCAVYNVRTEHRNLGHEARTPERDLHTRPGSHDTANLVAITVCDQ